MGSRIYGNLGTITDAQFAAVADRFDLGRFRRAWPLVDGLFGKNVALETDGGRWVLRGDPWPAGRDQQFRGERFFAQAIHEQSTVPAPWPYLVEPDPGVFAWPYAVMPYLEGEAHHDLSSDDACRAAAALGEGLARLHAVSWGACGGWQSETDAFEPFAGSAGDWLRGRTAAVMLSAAETSAPLDTRSERLVADHLDSAVASLDADDWQPSYVHHDFRFGNVSMKRHGAAFELSGVFDLQEGYAADPIEDLARALCDFISRHSVDAAVAFLTGYGSSIAIARLRAYVVFDRLVIWGYGRRPNVGWFDDDAIFADWVEECLRRVDAAMDQYVDAQ